MFTTDDMSIVFYSKASGLNMKRANACIYLGASLQRNNEDDDLSVALEELGIFPELRYHYHRSPLV